MSERWPWLDALRGLALAGIAFVNLTWFSGYAVLDEPARRALPTAALDPAVRTMIHVLVDAKLYSLFALLFGVGYGLLRRRLGAAGWIRRMGVLLLLGGAHANLLWFGDILGLYAVVGLALPLSDSLSRRGLVLVAITCLGMPALQHGLLACWVEAGAGAGAEVSLGPFAMLPAFGEGRYSDMLVANAAFLKMRWALALEEGRLFKLAGMFLLGVYAVRRGVVARPQACASWLRRVAVIGGVCGLSLELARVGLQPGTTLEIIGAALGVPMLAVAYAAAFTLRPWRWLAPAGRMSLTNYLMQSAIGVALFYGCGLGGWGRVGPTLIVPLVLVQLWVQRSLSQAWLRRFAAGPVEALWRRLARGRCGAG